MTEDPPRDPLTDPPADSPTDSPVDSATDSPVDSPPASEAATTAPEAAPAESPPAPVEDPLLPAAYGEDSLREAVGAPPPRSRRKRGDDDDDDGPRKPGGRRTMWIGGGVLVLGLVVATFALLGHANAQRYVIACAADRVSAEQGRSFPPWGTHPLIGAEWQPIALPSSAECKPRETEDLAELERWYLELLIDRASTTLTSSDLLDPVPTGKANPLDTAAGQLEQALLLSRAPERRDERKEVERLRGDVTYWRASLRLRDASAGLAEASRQFDAAAAQRPRHVTDAAQWAAFLRRLGDELHAGPGGVAVVPGPVEPAAEPSPAEPTDRPPAPPGEPLPAEPEPEPQAPAPPDAGLPTGGVLL